MSKNLQLIYPFELKTEILQKNSLVLIKKSKEILSIKKIVQIHDILAIQALVNKNFNKNVLPPYKCIESDLAALKEGLYTTKELYLYNDPPRNDLNQFLKDYKELFNFYLNFR